MKKSTFYIVLGIAAALLAGVAVYEWRRRKGITKVSRGEDYIPLNSEGSYTQKTFKGFNYNLMLNENTVHGEAEITALQYLINAYYGGPDSVETSGEWNKATGNAIQDITGKSTTNLYEFRYFYFTPLRGDAAAVDIFKELTEK